MIEGAGDIHIATHLIGGNPVATEYCHCLRGLNHRLTDVWLPGDDPNTGGASSGPLRHYGTRTTLPTWLWD